MEKNTQNKKKSNTETIPFNIHKLISLQYIKVIFMDTKKELHEIRTDNHTVFDDTIQLHINSREDFNITCPIGIVLKFVTRDAIYFAKAVLKEIRRTKDKVIFVLKAPQKTIRQQNRKFYRINIDRPCVLLVEGKNNNQIYVAQTVNISKGGVLISDLESMLNDEKVTLQLPKDAGCRFTIFLEHNLKIKTYAQYVRSEYVDETYRYGFQFFDIPQRYIMSFDKYLTNEEYKLLKTIKK